MSRVRMVFIVVAMAWGVAQAQLINENFIDGVYWNPQDAPSMGFAVSVQKGVFFGAIYGYTNDGKPSFITLLGEPDPAFSRLVYTGVIFVTETDGFAFFNTQVGNFSWDVDVKNGQAAAVLEISNSPVLRGELELIRFSFNEADGIDLVSETDWLGFFTIAGQTFAHPYSFGARSMANGMPFVPVTQRIEDPGTIVHGDNGVYGLLIPFSRGGTANGGTDLFYSCLGTSTQLYCVLWLLAVGESPADSPGNPAGLVSTRIQLDRPLPAKGIDVQKRLRRLQAELFQSEHGRNVGAGLLSTKDVMSAYRRALAVRDSARES